MANRRGAIRAAKLLVHVVKSKFETIPEEVFPHELKILRAIYADGVQLVGRVVDAEGNAVRQACRSPEKELERLKKKYAWIGEKREMNAAEVAYSNSPALLEEAMRHDPADDELEAYCLGAVTTATEGVKPIASAQPQRAPDRSRDFTKAEFSALLDEMGVPHKKDARRYELQRVAREAVEMRAEAVGVDSDHVRSDQDLADLIPLIVAAEEGQEASKAGAGAASEA